MSRLPAAGNARTAQARHAAKRLLDLCGSGLLLLLTSALLAVAALTVLVAMGRPILFRQERSGLHGQPFTIYKFRTMVERRSVGGEPTPDEQRLTAIGRLLRSLSIDELPELWNVLRGEMSLVGPRPLLTRYLDRYTPEQARRHEMRPGITGWAQVNGRNAVTWEDKLAFDVWYVDNWSLGVDLRILGRTTVSVVRRAGISQPGHATAEEFRGTATDGEDVADPVARERQDTAPRARS